MINMRVRSICSSSWYRLYKMIIALNQLTSLWSKKVSSLTRENLNIGYVFVLWLVKDHV